MHGILKVVHGSFTVSCYNKVPHFDANQHQHIPEALRNRTGLLERGFVVPVVPMMSKSIMNTSSSPLILSPDKDNYHELYNTSDQPAAFVDILSPPYNHKGSELATAGDLEARECEYFKVVNFPDIPANHEVDKSIAWLQMIQPPTDYNCDTEPYLGPPTFEL